MCCVAIAVFIGVGLWLTFDLQSSFTEIMKDRETLALQTSGLMSQRFFNTLTAADYVLQDITTSTTGEEINLASNDHERQNQLSTLLREKLATLPNVYGLGFLDQHCIYVAAADENIIGIKSNSKLNVQPGQVLERKTYVKNRKFRREQYLKKVIFSFALLIIYFVIQSLFTNDISISLKHSFGMVRFIILFF